MSSLDRPYLNIVKFCGRQFKRQGPVLAHTGKLLKRIGYLNQDPIREGSGDKSERVAKELLFTG
jgi:hypothetical protein